MLAASDIIQLAIIILVIHALGDYNWLKESLPIHCTEYRLGKQLPDSPLCVKSRESVTGITPTLNMEHLFQAT